MLGRMIFRAELVVLLSRAESSLTAHLAETPASRHNLLAQLYSDLRIGAHRETYPTARDLFWDDPQSAAEERCIDDALADFQFLRKSDTQPI